MLVLERNWGQKILIGDDIVIVLSHPIGKRGAKISIEAPKSTPILREEIAHKYKKTLPKDEQG
jgi:carbon storage regulator CsrA